MADWKIPNEGELMAHRSTRTVFHPASGFEPLTSEPARLADMSLSRRQALSRNDPSNPSGTPLGRSGGPDFGRAPSASQERSIRANRLAFQVDQAARDASIGVFSDFRLEQLLQGADSRSNFDRLSPGQQRSILRNQDLISTPLSSGGASVERTLAMASRLPEARRRNVLLENRRIRSREERTKTFSAFVKEQSRDRLLRQGLGSGTQLTAARSRAPSAATTGTTLLRNDNA